MKHTYPNLIIDTPAPGHYVIYGHKPQPVDTDEGRVVPLDQCYITDGIPSELLMDILLERGYLTGGVGFSPVADGIDDVGLNGPDRRIIDGLNQAIEGFKETTDHDPVSSFKAAVLSYLKKFGATRMKELTSEMACSVEQIKALDGQGLTVGHAGWVSLSEEGAQ